MSNYLRNMLINCEGEVNLLNVPITFEAIQDNSNVIFTTFNGTPSGSVRMQYRLGRSGEWIDYTPGNALPNLNKGESIQFQNLLEEKFSDGAYASSKRYGFSTSSGLFKVYGNIQSLMNWSETLPAYAFRFLFTTTKIYDASNLLFPAELTQGGCYVNMFLNCKDLVHAPREFPSKVIPNASYQFMFSGCSNLIDAPEFLGDELGSSGLGEFTSCFQNCTSLQKPPSNLYVKALHTSTYSDMFNNCSDLLYPPIIHATSPGQSSFKQMFYGCKNMIRCPELKNLSDCPYECFMYMFSGCESITELPEFPQVKSVGGRSFFGAFQNCKSVRNVNFIIHSTPLLSTSAFEKLFDGCSNLSYIKTNITSWDTGTQFENWVNGVASTGTFEAPETLPIEFGPSRIPDNWTLIGPKGIVADDQTLYFWSGIEKENKIQYASHTSNLKFEIVDDSLPTGLELTADGKIEGTINEELITHIDVKISTLDGSDIEKTITINIEVHKVNAYDPVFYFPCINEKVVYVKNGSDSNPLYFNQISTSSPITFSIDENGIYYLKIETNTSTYSNIFTLQAQNVTSNKFFNGSKTDFTIFYKLKVNEMFTSGNRNLIEIYGGTAGKSLRIGLNYDSEGNFINPYIDNYNCGDGNTFTFGSYTDRALNLGQWYDIVVTYESATKTYKCYIDKVHKTTSIPDLDITPNMSYINIGSRTNEGNWGKSIDSQLSDITIWTKVLTDEEIQSL